MFQVFSLIQTSMVTTFANTCAIMYVIASRVQTVRAALNYLGRRFVVNLVFGTFKIQ